MEVGDEYDAVGPPSSIADHPEITWLTGDEKNQSVSRVIEMWWLFH